MLYPTELTTCPEKCIFNKKLTSIHSPTQITLCFEITIVIKKKKKNLCSLFTHSIEKLEVLNRSEAKKMHLLGFYAVGQLSV